MKVKWYISAVSFIMASSLLGEISPSEIRLEKEEECIPELGKTIKEKLEDANSFSKEDYHSKSVSEKVEYRDEIEKNRKRFL